MNEIILVGSMMPSIRESLEAKGHRLFQVRCAEVLSGLGPDTLANARAALCGPVEGLGAADMDLLPRLEIISNFGVGYDNVDVAAASDRGVIVTHTPGVLNDEVADTTVALTIMAVRRLSAAERYLRDGRWVESAFPLTRHSLVGATIGIAGMGRVGKTILTRFGSFNAKMLYTDLRPAEGVSAEYCDNLVELARSSDVLISTLPGGAATKNLIGTDIFEALGPDGTFINIGRGDVVVEDDLIGCLADGRLGGAGLDVFRNEPNIPTELCDNENVVLLPHVGSASVPTREKMAALAADNVHAWFEDGVPLTAVPAG